MVHVAGEQPLNTSTIYVEADYETARLGNVIPFPFDFITLCRPEGVQRG